MIKLKIQLFGGRGASMSGIPKNKRKSILSYQKQIKIHKDKIKKALNGEKGYNKRTIPHWETEIKTMEGNIDKIYRRYKK